MKKYIVYKTIEKDRIGYVFGTVRDGIIHPLWIFFSKEELELYLRHYNLDEVIIVMNNEREYGR